jgi:hypothetical protein
MNFLELANEVASILDYDSVNTLQGFALDSNIKRVKTAINAAYSFMQMEFTRKADYLELQSTLMTTAGVDNYAIPSALEHLDWAASGLDQPIRIIPASEFEAEYKRGSWFVSSTSTGYPSIGCLYARRFYIFPTPDKVYNITVRGRAKFTPLTLDADTPLFPSSMDYCLIHMAVLNEYVYEGNPAAQAQQAIVEQFLSSARKALRQHGGLPPRVMSDEDLQSVRGARLL